MFKNSNINIFNLIKSLFVRIGKNVIWIITLTITITGCQFIIFALINKTLGKEFLGIWSIVIAATSIGQVSNFGLSNALVRYLPDYLQRKDYTGIEKMVGTVNASNFFFSLPLLVLLYFPAIFYAKHILNQSQFDVFDSVILWSTFGLFINNLFSVYACLFDGFQKFYIRCLIQISGWILYVISTIYLLPKFGLKGVGISFCVQNVWQLFWGVFAVRATKTLSSGFCFQFDKTSLKKIFSFGAKSQSIGVLAIFFDPLIKYFISKKFGLTGTANYELSNKIVLQGRNLLVNVNQIITPKIVIKNIEGSINDYFKDILDKNIFYSVTISLLVLLIAPYFTLLFSSHFDRTLITCIIIINFGWCCNMITSVHYYSAIGLDKMYAIIGVHLLCALSSSALFILLNFFQINSIFLCFFVPSLSLFVGSFYNSIALSKQIRKATYWIVSSPFLYFAITTILLLILPFNSVLKENLFILFATGLFLFLWRKRIYLSLKY